MKTWNMHDLIANSLKVTEVKIKNYNSNSIIGKKIDGNFQEMLISWLSSLMTYYRRIIANRSKENFVEDM